MKRQTAIALAWRGWWVLLAALWLLAACRSPSMNLPAETASPLAVSTTTLPITTAVIAEQVTAEPCAYAWAYQDAPELLSRTQQALAAAGLSPIQTMVRLFGENCVAADGSVQRFLAMSTTFEIELAVTDLADLPALGALTETLVTALLSLGELSTSQRDVRLLFVAGEQRRALAFSLRAAQEQLARGLSGAELLTALGYQPE